MTRAFWIVLAVLLTAGGVRAEQPIFDEMPRWAGGWGFQLLQDYRHYERREGEAERDGGLAERRAHRFHLQGVYTWQRWIRITAKLPYLLREERKEYDPEVLSQAECRQEYFYEEDVRACRASAEARAEQRLERGGLGNLTLALPLKRYFNLDDRSGSWTLNPQIRLPTALGGNHPDAGAGLWAGYETESYRYHFGVGGQLWALQSESKPQYSFRLKLGVNLHARGSSGHLKLWTSMDGGLSILSPWRLTMGPILYWRFTDLVHGQAIWRRDVIDHGDSEQAWRHADKGLQAKPGDGDLLRLGIGFVF